MLTRDAAKNPVLAWTWPALLIVAAIAATPVFACITPFVAIAALAAVTLSRRAALATIAAAWLGNQCVGFGLMHYPLEANAFVLGVSLLAGALAIVPLAEGVSAVIRAQRPVLVPLLTFAIGFALYEFITYLFALGFGGREAYTTSILTVIVTVNFTWALALGACYGALLAAVAFGNKALIRR
jgi:hypothetical protein